MEDVGPDRICVGMTDLKGAKRRFTLAPVFERLPLPVPGSDCSPLVTMYGDIPLDPVLAFCLMQSKA